MSKKEAGYSGTPLIRKLGIKEGMTVLPMNSPDHYFDLLGNLPDHVTIADRKSEKPVQFIHFFAGDREQLQSLFPQAKARLDKNGMIWASWIKKSSKIDTDISESDVRGLGLELGLVDIKICAVDQDWSGLKFMYRKEDR